ncbi:MULTISPECIES: hypothetical protein [Catenuloplanes]|uniref:Uncharacterized protein n=1 Tax=Catenuloplanes niger TaxID=587534 RepID=A0AAE4CSY6_9ACTN|nr:hypothetical protein [Catenuloplanes niger]MDR7324701.1 hypothetical protein [Catenuloplanes niger]
MNTVDPVRDTETALRDVRDLPIGELLASATPELDSALGVVLSELSTSQESLAAFGNAP